MKHILTALPLIAALVAPAKAETSEEAYCDLMSMMAVSVMQAHQDGVDRIEMIRITFANTFESNRTGIRLRDDTLSLIDSAVNHPRRRSLFDQRDMVDSFARVARMHCMSRIRQ